ncbi:Glycosyl transferase group 1 [uncultured delta proteobacterium]|uniref:Glycosyl transferase group 1 n=1 Tax=uncultured delta proteobacterium TaxID=34034 RepID=A0A212KBL4_9DELT|nr:Glycosyl transferase group 1 [uncultured delta proteobacterium]
MPHTAPARIALMLPRFSRYGGVEQFGYRLAEALAAKGHSVDFICARQEIAPPPGVRVLRTGRPHGPRWMKMLAFAARAETLRLAGRYDCSISLGKTLRQDILRVGGGPLPAFWRYSEKSYPTAAGRLLKQCLRRANPANMLTRWLENRQYADARLIVAVSHFVRDLIMEAAPGISPDRMRVIYNRPDLGRFSPPSGDQRENARRQFGMAPHVTAIGLATSNFQLKGTAPLIRALTRLPEHCALYVAGGRNHDAYDALAKKLGLADRVHFLGKVDDMPAWYQALDVFALPSFYDACSNAVLEALAAGLPTLSSASNGSAYFLPPENIVQDPGDSDELARALSRLIPQAGENAATGARRPFSWPDGVVSGLEAFVATVEDFLAAKQ